MSDPNLGSFKFIIEQIKELRMEIRDDASKRDRQFDKHTSDTDRRFRLMEEHLLSIQKFKWMALGITAFVLVVVELIVSMGQNRV